MKWLWAQLLPGDKLVVLLLLLLTAALALLQYGREPGRTVVVEEDGKVIFTAPLQSPQQVALPGPLGETRLQIADGEARVLSSPCPNQVCVHMGAISRSGELIACVPNRLLVRISGRPEGGAYDLISR